jgi:hypothetical protein
MAAALRRSRDVHRRRAGERKGGGRAEKGATSKPPGKNEGDQGASKGGTAVVLTSYSSLAMVAGIRKAVR